MAAGKGHETAGCWGGGRTSSQKIILDGRCYAGRWRRDERQWVDGLLLWKGGEWYFYGHYRGKALFILSVDLGTIIQCYFQLPVPPLLSKLSPSKLPPTNLRLSNLSPFASNFFAAAFLRNQLLDNAFTKFTY
jgi:hypothetical protein